MLFARHCCNSACVGQVLWRIRNPIKKSNTKHTSKESSQRGFGEELQMRNLEAGLSCFKLDTSTAADHLHPIHVTPTPEPAKIELLEILRTMERAISLPIQTLLTVIALLNIPDGGKSPIGLLQFIYRLWSATRRNLVTTWVDAKAAQALHPLTPPKVNLMDLIFPWPLFQTW